MLPEESLRFFAARPRLARRAVRRRAEPARSSGRAEAALREPRSSRAAATAESPASCCARSPSGAGRRSVVTRVAGPTDSHWTSCAQDRPAPDVLLGLYAGTLAAVILLAEPAETLHFGFAEDRTPASAASGVVDVDALQRRRLANAATPADSPRRSRPLIRASRTFPAARSVDDRRRAGGPDPRRGAAGRRARTCARPRDAALGMPRTPTSPPSTGRYAPYVGAQVVNRLFSGGRPLERGVHVHWHLPRGAAAGRRVDPSASRAAAGAGPLARHAPAPATSRARPARGSSRATTSPTSRATARRRSRRRARGEPPFAYLGRVYTLADWLEPKARAAGTSTG